MLKDVTLGQYFPGNTVVHRLDARTKLILVIVYIIGLFQAQGWLSYALICALTLLCLRISNIRLKNIFKGLKPMLFIIVLTAVLNIFYTDGTPILPGWIITWQGIERAAQMILRISLLITGTFLLTYTTSPIALTDGLEALLAPLKYVKVPVHSFSMMMTIALRFIPTLVEETDKIMSAQKARGADFSSGGIIKRARVLIPILIPLFVSSFKRAEDLAIAMECRCYRGGSGRTKMSKLKFAFRDALMIFAVCAFIAIIILGNRFIPIGFSV